MLVYLDTIGWNALCDSGDAATLRALADSEVLFSSCNLDEFSLASDDRARQLARFALRVSNGRKLHDHLELTAAEIRARQTGHEPAELFDDDPMFLVAWEGTSIGGLPRPVRQEHERTMGFAKRAFREHLRTARDLFRPVFESFAQLGVKPAWPEILAQLDRDGSLMKWVLGLLDEAGLLVTIQDPEQAAELSCLTLPATACWTEYMVGLSYLASFESGKDTKPDLGDQIDFRHAAYAGIADVFVTEDGRMRHVLGDLVLHRRAQVVGVDRLTETLESARQLSN